MKFSVVHSNLSQALQLIGGATVNGKLHDDNGRIAQLARSGKSPEVITAELYHVALGRTPTAAELAAATKHLKQVFDSSPAILAVSPFAMERQLYSLASHGATY